jgi:hypothetical protein
MNTRDGRTGGESGSSLAMSVIEDGDVHAASVAESTLDAARAGSIACVRSPNICSIIAQAAGPRREAMRVVSLEDLVSFSLVAAALVASPGAYADEPPVRIGRPGRGPDPCLTHSSARAGSG